MTAHFLRLTLLLWLGHALVGLPQAYASHAQAGQLTYQYVGTATTPNRYQVRLQFFRDCAGTAAPSTFVLNYLAGSCNSTPAQTAIMHQVGQPIVGSPYCAAVQATAVCPLTTGAPLGAPANFAIYTYEVTVTLPPAAEWILSAEESARPSVTNLAFGGTLRLEARLNNLIMPVGGGAPVVIQNSSPQFSTTNLPVPFVYVNQQATISFAASDADRLNGGLADSLVYSLERPLNGCGTFETYAAYPSTCVGRILSITPPCVLSCPASGPTNIYSPTLPISVAVDTVGSCPNKTLQPRFSFNAQQASFTFTPNRYVNIISSLGDNKYVVVGKVTEYRKINGRYYLVGSVRRDFLVIVISGGANSLPAAPTGQAGPPGNNSSLTITRDTTDLTVYSCNYTRVRFDFTDPDNVVSPTNPVSLNQRLTLFYPADLGTNALQSGDIGTFSVARNGTTNPVLTFYFQPTRVANGTTLLIPLRIEDNGCPSKGIQYRTLRVRVRNNPLAVVALIGTSGGSATGTGATLCTGDNLVLTGSVNRPDSVRNVVTGQVRLQVYRYQWAAVNGGVITTTPTPQNGLPTATTVAGIRVQPTVTTRYQLVIDPTLAFGQNVCGDTTSVLVTVVPPAVPPSITQSGNTLFSSAPTGNQWYRNAVPEAGATGVSFQPTASASYTVTTQVGRSPLACVSAPSAARAVVLGSRAALPGTSVSIAPNPTPDGRVLVTLTGYRQAVTLRVLDALGRTVSTATVAAPNPAGTVQELNLAAASAGVYVLHIRTVGGVEVRRVVRE